MKSVSTKFLVGTVASDNSAVREVVKRFFLVESRPGDLDWGPFSGDFIWTAIADNHPSLGRQFIPIGDLGSVFYSASRKEIECRSFAVIQPCEVPCSVSVRNGLDWPLVPLPIWVFLLVQKDFRLLGYTVPPKRIINLIA